ncbi:MAG: radical SAM family heme chaperone HemW [Gemmatimonadota bacterium]
MTGPTEVDVVYVHAPFCSRRCVYCDFAVQVRREGDAAEWVRSLAGELAILEQEHVFTLAPALRTLYVGGGTPSLLGPTAMARLADVVGRDRLTSPELEWTAEANPESLTPDVADAWAAEGVNRLSIGVQSFDDGALRWMGRLHGSAGAATAVGVARAAGITNLSVDLIFGLPRSSGRSWADDLQRALALDVPHISLYGLTVEAGTALGRAVREGREQPVDDRQYREEFLHASEVLTGAGYDQYEVSNFARPGARSRHNGAYWTGEPYLGIGNGAHSFAPPIRRWNVRSWDDYAAACAEGRSPEAEREVLDAEAEALEGIWLGLRTDGGVSVPRQGSPGDRVTTRWVEKGWATRRDDRVVLTSAGWLLLDELAVELDTAVSA